MMIKRFGDGRDWFFKQRFGMFVHWGIYSVAGWQEQMHWRGHMLSKDYVIFKDQFNPVKYNPEEWLDLVQDAGMEYVCFTTKHHDGFCMWDTALTDYKITNTPYKKDVLKMLADACHRRGIRLGLYYSCPDWHHPNSINLGGNHQLPVPNPGDQPDLMKYLDYVKGQITELCTNYGEISEFFWVIPPRMNIPEMNATLRRLQPNIMIDDRGYGPGDYSTPERCVPDGQSFTKPTEACQSVGAQSWGYRVNEDYYGSRFMMHCIDKVMAMGGNYLLNVGPKPDGTIPEQAADILRKIGVWYKKVKEAFVDCETCPELCGSGEYMVTRKGDNVYIHFPKGLNSCGYALNPIAVTPKSAVLLNTGTKLTTTVEHMPMLWLTGKECLHVSGLPVEEMQNECAVIKLEFNPGWEEFIWK